MTKEEFIARYLQRSGLTELPPQLAAYPCDCQESGCEGWQMLTTDGAEWMRHLGLLHG